MFAKILVTSFNVELVFTQTDNNKIIINVFKFQMIPKKRNLFFKEINSTRFSKFNFKLPKHTNRNFFHCSDDDLVKAFFCTKLVLKSAISDFKKTTVQLSPSNLRSNLLDGQFSNYQEGMVL